MCCRFQECCCWSAGPLLCCRQRRATAHPLSVICVSPDVKCTNQLLLAQTPSTQGLYTKHRHTWAWLVPGQGEAVNAGGCFQAYYLPCAAVSSSWKREAWLTVPHHRRLMSVWRLHPWDVRQSCGKSANTPISITAEPPCIFVGPTGKDRVEIGTL